MNPIDLEQVKDEVTQVLTTSYSKNTEDSNGYPRTNRRVIYQKCRAKPGIF